jgi:GWxTD domain-containing protein
MDQLTFEEQEDRHFASFELHVSLFDTTDQMVDSQVWNQDVTHGLGNFDLRSKAIILPRDFYLTPGHYIVKSVMKDSLSNRSESMERTFEVKSFSLEDVRISDIEFASRIETAKADGPFNKHGITVIPKPNRVYTSDEALLFYCEIINLAFEQGVADLGYTVEYIVSDLNGNEVLRQGPVAKKKIGSATTEASGIHIKELQQGNYLLRVIATDLTSNQADTARGYFTVLREEQHIQLTEEMAENFYHMVYHYLTKQERELYNTLELSGKNVFMYQYWKNRDPDPETPENEYQQEVFRRWAHICANYGGVEDAWKRDRGRIYMKYGEPLEIEKHLHDIETKAHEIWIYQQNNMQFVFVDLRMTGKFTLVSALTPDYSELYDADWERWIRISNQEMF